MPQFVEAQVSEGTADLAEYRDFLKTIAVGNVAIVPLLEGETPRAVMRSMNSAAGQVGIRLQRLPSEDDAVKFRVKDGEKRTVNMTDDARAARTAKAAATRQSKANANGTVNSTANGGVHAVPKPAGGKRGKRNQPAAAAPESPTEGEAETPPSSDPVVTESELVTA